MTTKPTTSKAIQKYERPANPVENWTSDEIKQWFGQKIIMK
jgi:hypothetical protein